MKGLRGLGLRVEGLGFSSQRSGDLAICGLYRDIYTHTCIYICIYIYLYMCRGTVHGEGYYFNHGESHEKHKGE